MSDPRPPVPTTTTAPDPVGAGLDPAALADLRSAFARRIDAGRIAGAVLRVERRGVLGVFEALGAQDPVRGLPMRTDSIFRIYSMTKPVVSVALMRLVERGRVLLRDPVAAHLPAFADAKVGVDGAVPERPMTVQDLLRHTAGLTYEFHAPSPVRRLYAKARVQSRRFDNAALADLLASLPLAHPPGSVWDYSRATDVAGRLVEVLADAPLGEHLRVEIFGPLGMVDTGFSVDPARHDRLAEPLEAPAGGPAPMALYDPRQPTPAENGGSGLLSTAADYARFCRMLLAGGTLDGARILGRKTVEFMTADHLGPIPRDGTVLPPGHGFGLGFAVRTAVGESTEPGSIGAFGWSGAAGTAFFVDPAERLSALVMTQTPALLDEVREVFRQGVYAALD